MRRLPPLHTNSGKRLVKSPKVYVRDSGLVLAVAPPRTTASFYRTSAGAEVDLVLDLRGKQRWAVEVKRSLSARPKKGFHLASEDIKASRRFVVHAGEDRYPVSEDIEAIGVRKLVGELASYPTGR